MNNKPIELVYEEFRQQIVALVNGSGLPPFIISAVLSNVLNEVNNLAQANYSNALTRFREEIANTDAENEP